MIIKIKEKNNLISSPKSVGEILEKVLSREEKNDQMKEHFWVIGLNVRNGIEYLELVSLGILNANIVHPRETFRMAITKGVYGIIIAHNHPSGDSQPSEEDLEITKRLVKAGKILGVKVIDHIIISGTEIYSFKESELI